jgi:hypothetical protein
MSEALRPPSCPVARAAWPWLVGATVAAVVAALAAASSPRSTAPGGSSEVRVPPPAASGPPAPRVTLTGTVRQRIDVSRYSYLEIATRDQGAVWAVVPLVQVAEGQVVSVPDAERHAHFTSHTLRRAFDVIYFASRVESPGHAVAFGSASSAPAAASAASLPTGPIARARGPLGRTIAEVYAQRQHLSGQKVRVRGVVIRSVAGVMRRSFVHLQDGSGSAAQGDHDLAVTTQSQPGSGQTVEFEGVVAVDRDFGSGYRYPVIVEDAKVIFGDERE